MALRTITAAFLVSLASGMGAEKACEAPDTANFLDTKSKSNLLQTNSKSKIIQSASSIPELFMGPGHDFCTDGVISESFSSGVDECGQRCTVEPFCKYFSLWLGGGANWCRLSSSCLALGQQGLSISIYLVPKPELFDGPGPNFCTDVLSESFSAGTSDCRSKCAADANCKFYSIWLTGGLWCRLSKECGTTAQQSWHSIEIWSMPPAPTLAPTAPPPSQEGVKAAKEGVSQYGRSWYLSDPGQNCIDTCFKYGLGYRFGRCSGSLLPDLLGFVPSNMGNKWVAFDVYNFKDDMQRRYKNCAANDYRDSDGTWSNPDHQLACPCGKVKECVWKQPDACETTFYYDDIRWSGCIGYGRSGDPWCQHSERDQTYWSHCIKTCYDGSTGQITQETSPSAMQIQVPKKVHTVANRSKDTPPVDFPVGCSWVAPADCVSEFNLGSAHFMGCAKMLENGESHTPWCSKSETFQGSWNHCVFTCPGEITPEQAKAVDALNAKAAADSRLCWMDLASGCVPKSKFNGIEYTGCITPEEGDESFVHDESRGSDPWCSYDYDFKGNGTTCELKCAGASNTPR
mmetsp:Transcript_64837/g.107445  ORF Transcript_64837/g.107445 Transcript_64837/m.107445 type:complete len:572 (-) Transcript_64837:138-1853(-)